MSDGPAPVPGLGTKIGAGRGAGAGPPKAAEPKAAEDATDVLAEDLEAIRARLKGNFERQVQAELAANHQVDLGHDEAAGALEDARLADHREGARHRLAQHEMAMTRLPKQAELRTAGLGALGEISELTRNVDALVPAEDDGVEKLFHHASALEKLSRGASAHGYPNVGAPGAEVVEAFAHAAGAIKENAEEREKTVAQLKAIKASLFRIRRDADKSINGLIELITAAEEDRRLLREAFQRADTDPGAKAPDHTAGEKILAAKKLPEHA